MMNNDFMDNLRIMCLHIRAYRAHYSTGDYTKGLKLYQQILDSDHRSITAYLGLGVCYRMLGDNEAAVAAAKEALNINPDFFAALQLLATIYSDQDKDEITYEYVSRALSNIPPSTAKILPKVANFTKKIAPYMYSGKPDDYVEEMLGLDEEDRAWISWASEFKKEYESQHPDSAQLQTRRVHSDAPEGGA